MVTLNTFYQSSKWKKFREVLILKEMAEKGDIICEYCHKPIVKKFDTVLHHKDYLTEANVNDVTIALNSDNIAFVHHKCHNLIHEKFKNFNQQKVFLVYGAPLSGKTRYVNDIKCKGDLIIDIDDIWQCLSGCERYEKPACLNENVFKIKNELIEQVHLRLGKWHNAYIIGGYPYVRERERLIKKLSAEEIFIDTPKEECLQRLKCTNDLRSKYEWEKYINDWFEIFKPI